jgi:hypothetical protein
MPRKHVVISGVGAAGEGLLLAFVMLLATMQLRPYAHPTLNLVAQSAQLNLFLLLLVGVLLKLNIDGEPHGRERL